jgi:deazaflavin-dependent oxidoreductase (nitroreductase family)
MPSRRELEVAFFRALNRVAEPLVRAGLGSPRIAPGGLIVLEMKGRRSGRALRIPLAATRLGEHVLVATYRGDRSQWVRNLAAEPRVRFWLAGRPRAARAYLVTQEKRSRLPASVPAPLHQLASFLAPLTAAGWAFALLAPTATSRAPRSARAR